MNICSDIKKARRLTKIANMLEVVCAATIAAKASSRGLALYPQAIEMEERIQNAGRPCLVNGLLRGQCWENDMRKELT